MNTNTIDNTHKSLIIYITPTPPEGMLQIFNMKYIRLDSHFPAFFVIFPCLWLKTNLKIRRPENWEQVADTQDGL